jgi:hypothetical protein
MVRVVPGARISSNKGLAGFYDPLIEFLIPGRRICHDLHLRAFIIAAIALPLA